MCFIAGVLKTFQSWRWSIGVASRILLSIRAYSAGMTRTETGKTNHISHYSNIIWKKIVKKAVYENDHCEWVDKIGRKRELEFYLWSQPCITMNYWYDLWN